MCVRACVCICVCVCVCALICSVLSDHRPLTLMKMSSSRSAWTMSTLCFVILALYVSLSLVDDYAVQMLHQDLIFAAVGAATITTTVTL